MKKLKKTMLSILCVCVVLSATACGARDDGKNNDNNMSNQTQNEDNKMYDDTENDRDDNNNNIVDDMGDAIGDGVDSVGDAIGDGMNDIGDGVKDMTNDMTGTDGNGNVNDVTNGEKDSQTR